MNEDQNPIWDHHSNKKSLWIKLRPWLIIVAAAIIAIAAGYFGTQWWTNRDQSPTPVKTSAIPDTTADSSLSTPTPTISTPPTPSTTPTVLVSLSPKALASPSPTATVAPTITNATTLDSDSDGKIDTIKVTFSGAMDTSIGSTGGIKVSDYTVNKISWASSTNLNIILNENSSYDTDATPTLTYLVSTGKLKSSTGVALAAASIKTKDTSFPVAVSATAIDVNSASGIQAGDKVVITFSEPVKTSPSITASNINQILPLNNSHSWKDGSEAIGSVNVSLDNKTIAVVLSAKTSAPTVAVDDSIHLYDGADSITDLSGNAVNNTSNKVQITGSF